MKIYVAASFSRKEDVLALYRKLGEKGHEITADWTEHKRILPFEENRETAARYAFEDIEGVKNSEIFILLAGSQSAGTGGYKTELGAAIMSYTLSGKPKIYVIGDTDSMFYFHPAVNRREKIDHVLEEIG